MSKKIDRIGEKSYKKYKETIIKSIADEYKNMIPCELYNSLQNYEVEIND